jgi:hypothetical protein
VAVLVRVTEEMIVRTGAAGGPTGCIGVPAPRDRPPARQLTESEDGARLRPRRDGPAVLARDADQAIHKLRVARREEGFLHFRLIPFLTSQVDAVVGFLRLYETAAARSASQG